MPDSPNLFLAVLKYMIFEEAAREEQERNSGRFRSAEVFGTPTVSQAGETDQTPTVSQAGEVDQRKQVPQSLGKLSPTKAPGNPNTK